jgi:hypothetical protein
MKKRLLSVLLVLSLVLSLTPVLAQAAGGAEVSEVTTQGWEVLRLTNQHRMEIGEPPLSVFSSLQQGADLRAEEIIEVFEHTRPDGRDWDTVFDEFSVENYDSWGENIARGYGTPAAVMTGWLNSDGHRENIEKGSYTHLGVGFNAAQNTWTQNFIGSTRCTFDALTLSKTEITAEVGQDLEDILTAANIVVSANCSVHGACTLPLIADMCTGYDKTKEGSQTVTVTYGGKTATLTITTGTPLETHTVTYDLTNVTVQEKVESVGDNSALTVTLIADEKYTLPETITVTMGEETLKVGSDYAYNPETGVLTIGEVTDDVTITAKAIVTYAVSFDLARLTVKEAPEYVKENGALTLTLAATRGYILPETVTVTMGGTVLEDGKEYSYNCETGVITIGKVTADVKIIATGLDDPNGAQVFLDGLTVSVGTLTPNFVPEETEYTLAVEQNQKSITVTPSAAQDLVITVNGMIVTSGKPSSEIPLDEGENKIVVVVKTADDTFSETYTIVVTRAGEAHTITVAELENGKVTVTPEKALKDEKVTVTVQPDEGYELETLTAKDENGKTVFITENEDGTLSFTMPDAAVTIEATFVSLEVEWVNPYVDVTEANWYYDAVKYVTENKLMDGVGNKQFAGTTELTRGMIVTILYRQEGEPAAASAGFKDVASGEWYYDAVNWAAQSRIVEGYGNGEFSPKKPITREELAIILYRYAAYKKYDTTANGDLSGFADAAQVSSWAKDALVWAVNKGVINGVGNNMLDPRGTATRAQVAQMLMNYLENVK